MVFFSLKDLYILIESSLDFFSVLTQGAVLVVPAGYLLPIINKLLVDKETVSKPPYALVLLPTIELCHQVRSDAIK